MSEASAAAAVVGRSGTKLDPSPTAHLIMAEGDCESARVVVCEGCRAGAAFCDWQ